MTLQPEPSHLVLQAVVHTSAANTKTSRLGSQPWSPALSFPMVHSAVLGILSAAVTLGVYPGTLLVNHQVPKLSFFLNQNSDFIQESPSSPMAQIKLFQRSGS